MLTPQVKGSVPRDCPPLQTAITSSGFLGYLHFCLTWLRIGGSPIPSSAFIICYVTAHRTQGNTLLLPFYDRGYYKGYKQPDEEVHKARSRRVPHVGASVPLESRVCHPPGMRMHSSTPKHSEPLHLGSFYGGFITRHDWLNHWLLVINSILCPSPHLRVRGWGWKF